MNARPAMPDAARTVQRSVRIARMLGARDEYTARVLVYSITVEVMAQVVESTGDIPGWLTDLTGYAQDMCDQVKKPPPPPRRAKRWLTRKTAVAGTATAPN